jgi:hypothetical protein
MSEPGYADTAYPALPAPRRIAEKRLRNASPIRYFR